MNEYPKISHFDWYDEAVYNDYRLRMYDRTDMEISRYDEPEKPMIAIDSSKKDVGQTDHYGDD